MCTFATRLRGKPAPPAELDDYAVGRLVGWKRGFRAGFLAALLLLVLIALLYATTVH